MELPFTRFPAYAIDFYGPQLSDVKCPFKWQEATLANPPVQTYVHGLLAPVLGCNLRVDPVEDVVWTYRLSRWREDVDVCDVRKYPLPIVPP